MYRTGDTANSFVGGVGAHIQQRIAHDGFAGWVEAQQQWALGFERQLE